MARENTFDMLESKVRNLAKERFSRPTGIQQLVIPEILRGENVLVISETGSGKTESVLLPIFSMLQEKGSREEGVKPISVFYITPLRSLNRDLLKRILWWSNHLAFDVSVRHGDTSQYERSMQAQNPSDMFISTPETLQAILTGKLMKEHLKNIKWVVIDEVHELIDNKRGVQLSVGLERLKELIRSGNSKEETGSSPQIIGLSATVGSPQTVAKFLTRSSCKILNTAKARSAKIRVESPKTGKKDYEVSEHAIISPGVAARIRRIDELIQKKKSVLVFTNTRESAEILSSRLRIINPKLPIEAHHSSLSREVRIKAEEDFKERKTRALLCTSSLELGIDIGSIDFILQYMSPRQVIKLLQRVGRSGHELTRTPEGVIISSDADDCFESAAIADLALRGLIEPTKSYYKALDVLGHQIVGLALDEYKIPADKAYEIVRKAYPFRDLTKEDFYKVCSFMQRLRVLWFDTKYTDDGKPALKRRKNSFLYYYNNLSTIPDVKNYKIIDVVSNKPVGSLDAEFIAMHGRPGGSFIVKGQAWRVLDIGKTRILVEPMPGIEAAIPAWEGERIPVPYDVAQGVGRLRKEISDNLNRKDIVGYLAKKHPIDREVAKRLVKVIRSQANYGFVPDDKKILIEHGGFEGDEGIQYIVIHSCFGSLVNDTIGRVLSTLLMNRLGSVGLQTDPYRIIIKIPGYGWKEVVETFKKLSPDVVKTVLELALPDTELFMWRFMHAAKRFGIISRDADFGKVYLKKIIEAYSNTPVYHETMNEIMQDKLDMEKTLEVIKKIKKGEIKIVVKGGLSPLGRAGIERRYEIIAPGRPEKEIFEVFKKRLLDTQLGLICCNCGRWLSMGPVRDFKENMVCKSCGAKLISTVPPRYAAEAETIIKKHIEKRSVSKEEKKWLNWILDAGGLVLDHGLNAVKVMAGRGIGPKTAARVLSKMHTGDELLRDVLNQERIYAKTRRFWRG